MILESLQRYNDGGRFTNPKDHPAERNRFGYPEDMESKKCGYCFEKDALLESNACEDCQGEAEITRKQVFKRILKGAIR